MQIWCVVCSKPIDISDAFSLEARYTTCTDCLFKRNENQAENTKGTIRGNILREAINLIENDRNATYGDPYEGMACFIQLVNIYLGLNLKPSDGALIMMALKTARHLFNPYHMDNIVDLEGYGAMRGECLLREREQMK